MAIAAASTLGRFAVSIVHDQDHVTVVAIGDLDMTTVGAVEGEVRRLLDGGSTEIVMDLRRVTFIDSRGLQLLIVLRNAAIRAGGSLRLLPGSDSVQRLFSLTGTAGLFRWG